MQLGQWDPAVVAWLGHLAPPLNSFSTIGHILREHHSNKVYKPLHCMNILVGSPLTSVIENMSLQMWFLSCVQLQSLPLCSRFPL